MICQTNQTSQETAFMTDMAFLGIDLGTSAIKTILVDGQQRILATATTSLQTSRTHPGWSEQAPEDWWDTVCATLATLRSQAGGSFGPLRAIGLSGQMHGLVLLDSENRVLRPAILWNDGRASAEAELFTKRHPEFSQITGAAQSPSFWPAKLLWLQRHETETFARIRRLLLPKDYLRLRLTGLYQTDGCDAGGTLLFDEARRCWSPEILSACQVPASWLPELVEGDRPAGILLGEVAESWGLAGDVVVAGSGGDAATGAIGI